MLNKETIEIWDHMRYINILIVVVKRLSKRWKMKTLLASLSSISSIETKIINFSIFNRNMKSAQ